MRVKTKFTCDSVTAMAWGSTTVQAKEAILRTYYTGNPEDNEFAKATPSGEIKVQITNPATMDFLQPGKQYYVYFEEAPATQPDVSMNSTTLGPA